MAQRRHGCGAGDTADWVGGDGVNISCGGPGASPCQYILGGRAVAESGRPWTLCQAGIIVVYDDSCCYIVDRLAGYIVDRLAGYIVDHAAILPGYSTVIA
jgi:hypothetical protein